MKADTMSQAEDNWRAISNQGILQAEGKYEEKNSRSLYDRGSILAAAAAAVQGNFLPLLAIPVLIKVQIFFSKKEATSLFGPRHISRPITVACPQLSITLCECGISDTGYRLID